MAFNTMLTEPSFPKSGMTILKMGKSSGLLGTRVHVDPPMKIEYRDILIERL
jgi:hypothetical protein